MAAFVSPLSYTAIVPGRAQQGFNVPFPTDGLGSHPSLLLSPTTYQTMIPHLRWGRGNRCEAKRRWLRQGWSLVTEAWSRLWPRAEQALHRIVGTCVALSYMPSHSYCNFPNPPEKPESHFWICPAGTPQHCLIHPCSSHLGPAVFLTPFPGAGTKSAQAHLPQPISVEKFKLELWKC